MQVNQPSAEQIQAIIRFAAKHGRTWKSKLRDVWMDGNYHGTMFSGSDACYLQAVRNQFGPSWLVKFNLKAAKAAQATTPAPEPVVAADEVVNADTIAEYEDSRVNWDAVITDRQLAAYQPQIILDAITRALHKPSHEAWIGQD